MTAKRLAALFPILILSLFVGVATARADVTIPLETPNVKPLPIAITDMTGNSQPESDAGKRISAVVSADLERSGLFAPIDPHAFIQTADSLKAGPNFGDWKAINAQALVQGTVQLAQNGQLRVEFRLWDVLGQSQMVGLAFTAVPAGERRIAHKIADQIYKRITGEDGYFDTQIVYVAESGPASKRIRRLAIMDQDGENHRFITDGSDIVITPRFSPNTREITYMSFFHDIPRVYVLQLDSGRRELLGDFQGLTFAPRFAPDGNSVVMSRSENGNTNIYTMDLRTRKTARVTNDTAIDTGPSFAPDGSKIAFESDRSGSQQIYTMNADGSAQTRISFGDGSYAEPVWSPRGDLIAFTKQKGNTFYIGVMHPDGSGERLLSQGFLVESPTWAPNGRVLAFYRQNTGGPGGGSDKLYTIDLTGYNERQLVTPLDASDPAWSPLIP